MSGVETPNAVAAMPAMGEPHQILATGAAVATQTMGVSVEMRRLLVQYCAQSTYAISLEEVKWMQLAIRLGVNENWLKEAAQTIDTYVDGSTKEVRRGVFWYEVLTQRIKSANASRAFRDVSWERLESETLRKLTELADSGLIRDVGELLAIANMARKINVHEQAPTSNQGGNNVSITFTNGAADANGLPPAGSTMQIDLSPRLASSLANKEVRPAGARVIDGEMLSATELRAALDARNIEIAEATQVKTEGESDV